MDKVTNTSDRLLIATKLFDDEQAKLHTTMALTTTEYDNQAKAAQKLGAIITEQEAAKAAAYTESMQKLDAQNAAIKKSIILNDMGGLNLFSAESQMSRGRSQQAFFEGSALDKAEIYLTAVTAGLYKPSERIAKKLAAPERSLEPRIISEKEKTEFLQREAIAKQAERDARFAKNKKEAGTFAEFFAKEKKRAAKEMATANRLGMVGEVMNKISGQGIGEMIGKGLVASLDALPEEFGKPEKQDQFEAIVTDPLDSIAASSSEAFKIQNKNTSFQKVTEEADKETAKNTKQTADGVGTLVGLLENATGIGL